MFKTYVSLLFFLPLLMCGCSEDVVLIDTQDVSEETHGVSEAKALEIASAAIKQLGGVESRSGVRSFKVGSVIHVGSVLNNRSEDHVGFYVINYESGGYVLVADDDRATQIYAISETGQYDVSPESPTGYFLELATVAADMERDGLIDREQPTSPAAVDPLPFEPDTGQVAGFRVEHGDHICIKFSETHNSIKFHLLQTEWHQRSPFNSLCFTTDGKQSYGGCVPIAMGQVMAYHNKPTRYNGHDYAMAQIRSTPLPNMQYHDNVANLIHDIGICCSIEYRTTGASIKNRENITKGFHAMGYTSTYMRKYSIDKVVTELDNGYPIVVFARDPSTQNQHAWAIDGYYYVTIHSEYYREDTGELCTMTSTPRKYYVHCNWGYKNPMPGFYYNLAFQVDDNSYTDDINAFYSIK